MLGGFLPSYSPSNYLVILFVIFMLYVNIKREEDSITGARFGFRDSSPAVNDSAKAEAAPRDDGICLLAFMKSW